MLGYLGILDRATHRPAQLSGGEQQRVAIARAVANAPDILLADEPTGNLDPTTADTVIGALEALVAQTGLAVLLATHNMELAARMERRVTLEQGRVVELAYRTAARRSKDVVGILAQIFEPLGELADARLQFRVLNLEFAKPRFAAEAMRFRRGGGWHCCSGVGCCTSMKSMPIVSLSRHTSRA